MYVFDSSVSEFFFDKPWKSGDKFSRSFNAWNQWSRENDNFVKQILNKTSSNEDNQNIKLRSHDGSLMEDQNEIVNSFNNFFATIGNTLAEKQGYCWA